MKHVEIDNYFFKEHLEKKNVELPCVASKEHLVDMLTKSLLLLRLLPSTIFVHPSTILTYPNHLCLLLHKIPNHPSIYKTIISASRKHHHRLIAPPVLLSTSTVAPDPPLPAKSC
ncbi:unnamed protein product [Lactuca virosa]|uniref:Uncharacterized protein n=1 Tax=Lactuca virosa TaxID=75947 RepID=A0AAU9MTS5_9ASTR|nr:unnamed protein product [Lactuca virosa]